MSTVSRRNARESAFKFLFSQLPDSLAMEPLSFSHSEFTRFCEDFSLSHDEFAWELTEGTGQKLPELDALLREQSAHWRVERMPRVDRTILRLAAFEILHRSDIPKSVAINEAVELAKEYGETGSPAFVNGILDKISKPT